MITKISMLSVVASVVLVGSGAYSVERNDIGQGIVQQDVAPYTLQLAQVYNPVLEPVIDEDRTMDLETLS